MKGSNLLVGTGLIAAIGSSLCCIVPVIAAVGSISGVAASFSWVEPARPFLIGFTILALGFAWYQNLRVRKNDPDCDCEDVKPRFWQTKGFLGGITAVATLAISFPAYSHIFFPKPESQVMVVEHQNMLTAELAIDGMTCTGCEESVNYALRNQAGVIEVTSSYENGLAVVKFDKTRTSLSSLSSAVEKETGYEVIETRTTSQ